MNAAAAARPSVRAGLLAAVVAALLTGGLATAWFVRNAPPPDPLDLVRLGMEATDGGNLVLARRVLRELTLRSETAAAHVLRAKLITAQGFMPVALESLAGVPEDGAVGRLRDTVAGEIAWREGRIRDAETLLERVLEADPESLEAHRVMAAMCYDIGAMNEALVHLDATARLAPLDPRPHRLLGLIHNDYELYAEAIPFYRESLRRGPNQPDREEVLAELASCQLKIRDHQAALATLEGAGQRPEDDLLRAEAHLALGHLDEARDLVTGVLERAPEAVEALVLRGSILLEDGAAATAIEPLETAIRIEPMHFLAHFKLAQAYEQAGRPEDGAREVAESERIRLLRKEYAALHQEAWDHPEDPTVRRRLAELAETLGRPDLRDVWLEAAAAVARGSDPAAVDPSTTTEPAR